MCGSVSHVCVCVCVYVILKHMADKHAEVQRLRIIMPIYGQLVSMELLSCDNKIISLSHFMLYMTLHATQHMW